MSEMMAVYTARNGRNEEIKISAIDELMGMIETEWKRCRKVRLEFQEKEFQAKVLRKELLESEARLEALGRILNEYGLKEGGKDERSNG